jgi:predicted RNA binding protein YcfA (HicA-like mRNA interferase family)
MLKWAWTCFIIGFILRVCQRCNDGELLSIFSELAYYIYGMKVREVLKLLKYDGWHLVISEGSHRQFKHPTKQGRVTVSGHPSDDIHPKTLKSILTQAGMPK